ncbi:hypothetical protein METBISCDRAFT_16428 [Metschnikowia bicuspidata]|uniref:VHS-domain-containing protein n=1 Tax=Metschnikowia bicuspidata TaxID=27322 RepID=A0A4P9ZEM3_9ASCO|nr:hypothetical protein METBISCDRAFT_16428 [Metschnikowia bicuspidata]
MSSGYSLSSIDPKLLRRMYRACRPTLTEPNLSLNLEVCDYVNARQGSIPRETAIAIAKLVNQRDPQTTELALHLLDNLVKNCGYPFHLQISRKEFLNELVKRFPERPALRYTHIQRMILAQIEEWYQTICKTSKYREDFTYIRDMHRLLSKKGYVFPEVKTEDVAVLNPSDNLKLLEEIQKEEAVVHSAKLQELIRSGKPQDLQEANRLMKIMAGFKDDNVAENKKQVSDDVARLKRKTEIFAEMLNTAQESNTSCSDSNDTMVELYSSIKSASPIVTKIIEEEGHNEEYVRDLLQFNDVINQLTQKFQLLKAGDVSGASNVQISSTQKEQGLIDFDDEPISSDPTGKDEQGYQDLLADLSNLSFACNSAAVATKVNPLDFFGSGGSIALGTLSTSLQQPVPVTTVPISSSGAGLDLVGDLDSPSPQLQPNTAKPLDPFSMNFPSSTPAAVSTGPSEPSSVMVAHDTDDLKIEIEFLHSSGRTSGRFYISNKNSDALTRFKLLVAAPKGFKLELRPQSGDVVYGYSTRGLLQEFTLNSVSGKALKLKWKADFSSSGVSREEQGLAVL